MPAADQGVSVSKDRYAVIPRALIFVFYHDEVLLIKGAPHKKIWAGLYNGIGGHVERAETIIGAAQRELTEETGLTSVDLQQVGIINIDAGSSKGIILFVFAAKVPERPLTMASDEGELNWIPLRDVTAETAVEDLPTILPKVVTALESKKVFHARYWYDEADSLQIDFAEA